MRCSNTPDLLHTWNHLIWHDADVQGACGVLMRICLGFSLLTLLIWIAGCSMKGDSCSMGCCRRGQHHGVQLVQPLQEVPRGAGGREALCAHHQGMAASSGAVLMMPVPAL